MDRNKSTILTFCLWKVSITFPEPFAPSSFWMILKVLKQNVKEHLFAIYGFTRTFFALKAAEN